jgi:spore germination protein
MHKSRPILQAILILSLLMTQTGCWSSKEIEDLAVYVGLALDSGLPTSTEQELEDRGSTYSKQNKVTATIQIVPVKSPTPNKEAKGKASAYLNTSETGDSVLEIFRQFSIRRDRPIIGHHLKIIVVSSKLLRQVNIKQLMDFVLRDNDIRPSTKVFLSSGVARNTLTTARPGEIPAFHINEMIRNQYRTSKVMSPVILSKLDALMHAKKSFILQNIIEANGEVTFSGAGVIKGDTGHWIGNMSQEDVECISWLTNEGKSGVIKAIDEKGEPITYEIKSMKTDVKAKTDSDGELSFQVHIRSEGRLSEDWNIEGNPSIPSYQEHTKMLFAKKLESMMNHLMLTMQTKYKADVADFGEAVRIQRPRKWQEVKSKWDHAFSQTPVSIKIDLEITDFGSSTE